MLYCIDCPAETEPNFEKNACVSSSLCLKGYKYNPATLACEKQCGPTEIRDSLGNCKPKPKDCTSNEVRASDGVGCSTCPSGSIPNIEKTLCIVTSRP